MMGLIDRIAIIIIVVSFGEENGFCSHHRKTKMCGALTMEKAAENIGDKALF